MAGAMVLKKYLAISTPEVYGTTGHNIKESFNFSPSTPYAASKLASDLFLLTLFKRYNFPVVITRSSNVCGKHQQLYRIIPKTIISLKLGKKIELHGRGKSVRSFIHVRDVAEASLRLLESEKIGEAYHLALDGEGITIYSLVKKICSKMGYDFDKSTLLIEENFGQDAVYSLDSSKAEKELNWQPQLTLDDAIDETITWIEENWNKIKSLPVDYIHKE